MTEEAYKTELLQVYRENKNLSDKLDMYKERIAIIEREFEALREELRSARALLREEKEKGGG